MASQAANETAEMLPARSAVLVSKAVPLGSCADKEYENLQAKEGTWKRPNVSVSTAIHREWIERTRTFLVWLNHKGAFSHHSLGLSYETEEIAKGQAGQRFLKAEIMFRENPRAEMFLKYTGPGTASDAQLDMTAYTKKAQFSFTATIKDVRMLCDEVFDCFPSYNVYANNCQHFVERVEVEIRNRFTVSTQVAELVNMSTELKVLPAESSSCTRSVQEVMQKYGWTAKDFGQMGYPAEKLKEAGFKAKEMRDAGYPLQSLKQADFEAEELGDAGFSWEEMADAGFSIQQLTDAGVLDTTD